MDQDKKPMPSAPLVNEGEMPAAVPIQPLTQTPVPAASEEKKEETKPATTEEETKKGKSAQDEKEEIETIETDGARAQREGQEGLSQFLMNAVAQRMESLIGNSSGYVASLPPSVQRRVRALKKIQSERDSLEETMQEEMKVLEQKFNKMFEEVDQKRAKIVKGEVEPTDEEAAEENEGEGKDKTQTDDAPMEESGKEEKEDDVKGVPEFWLSVMMNHEEVSSLISDEDHEALKYLEDVVLINKAGSDDFELQFFFAENPFFTNRMLSKKYVLGDEDDEDMSQLLDKIEGTTIEWKEGKNLTVKKIKKKQKKKGTKQTRTITVDKQCDSFFNFFKSIAGLEGKEMDDEEFEQIGQDFDVGVLFREKLIPHAVDWFLGDAAESDDDDESFEEGSEDGEEDSEDDPDFVPTDEPPPECNQQ